MVPPLPFNNKGSPLELHSSPVHLATRSLSARSTHSGSNISAQSSTVSLSSKRSTQSAPLTTGKLKKFSAKSLGRSNEATSSSRRKQKRNTAKGHAKNGHTSGSHGNIEIPLILAEESAAHTSGRQSQSRGSKGTTTEVAVQGAGEERKDVTMSSSGGFNIAEHLQRNVDPERTDGSLSPDINQFLQDIGSLVQSASPNHSQIEEVEKECSEEVDKSAERNAQPSPHQKSRPRIAANFGTVDSVSSEGSKPVEISNSNSQSPMPDSTDLDPNMAAAKIQHWYRDNKRKQAAQVHSLLANKRDELNRSRSEELQRIQQEIEAKEAKEMERQKRRAAKMQAARRAAIEDLKKKREEKRERAEKIAQEEIVSCTEM